MTMQTIRSGLVRTTETILTSRLKKKLAARMRQQAKHPVRDWIEAIIWAACVVLVVNQYLFQAYRIPSESMVNTLLIGDMIFVDKLRFGPELLPGVAKLPGLQEARRGQVVVFENPTYISRGPLYTIVQQMLYMLTLTLVDIDRDEDGQPRVHYLIKRAVGMPGDRIRVVRGDVEIMPAGTGAWVDSDELLASSSHPSPAIRSVPQEQYAAIEGAGIASAYREAGVAVPAGFRTASSGAAYADYLGYDHARVKTIYAMYPNDQRFSSAYRRSMDGWYIPEGRVFLMGDNRDNSRDSRYFGPVAHRKVLGKALFRYFPFGRIGAIR